MNHLYKKSCLRLIDYSSNEIYQILSLACHLKKQKYKQQEIKYLINKNIILIFENHSTRTRCAFEVAAFDQGAQVTCLTPNISQIGHKESIKDTAKILERIYDGILYRGYHQNTVNTLAQHANIPIWNGLTAEFHPTQLLADLMTMQEQLPNKNFNQMKLAFVGDTKNNISNSLLEAAALTGMELRLVAPKNYWPVQSLLETCQKISKKNKGSIILTEDISKGVKNVDFLYTDVWVSMGENEKIWKQRISYLHKYQVNQSMIEQTNNPNVKFLHCLPAFHDNQTIIGKKISLQFNINEGLEVTNDIFESKYSIVFEQAENKLHTAKSLMILTILPNKIK